MLLIKEGLDKLHPTDRQTGYILVAMMASLAIGIFFDKDTIPYEVCLSINYTLAAAFLFYMHRNTIERVDRLRELITDKEYGAIKLEETIINTIIEISIIVYVVRLIPYIINQNDVWMMIMDSIFWVVEIMFLITLLYTYIVSKAKRTVGKILNNVYK